MVTIAICDDNLEELESTRVMTESIMKERGQAFELDTFSEPLKVVESLNSNKIYDVYILDIFFSGVLGTNIAKKIRTISKQTKIIFATTSKDYAVDAYSVNAEHYLIKPFKREDLDEAFNRVLNAIVNEEHYIVRNTSDGLIKLDVNMICYSESSGHYQYIHMSDKRVYKVRSKTDELWEELQKFKSFIRPHSGYILNMDYIKTIAATGIKIGEIEVPITNNRLTQIKHAFMEYTFNKK